MPRDKYLSIYLNDHLAALTVLRDVARRSERANHGTDAGDYLAAVASELDGSRATLRRVMDALGVRVNPLKTAAAWFAEKAGRLKLNGHLVSYSPLSRVLELEALSAGADVERRTWEAVGPLVGEDFSSLVERVERRRDELARHHREATAVALGRGAT